MSRTSGRPKLLAVSRSIGKALRVLVPLALWAACSSTEAPDPSVPASPEPPGSEPGAGGAEGPVPPPSADPKADVVRVATTGAEGAYSFSVTVESPDTGCMQYADWWEVLTPDGELIYRRILAHSHVDEQPFTRSGGPVDVDATTEVIVRAHMNEAGYGGAALSGSVSEGFSDDESVTASVAPSLADAPPLPEDCAF